MRKIKYYGLVFALITITACTNQKRSNSESQFLADTQDEQLNTLFGLKLGEKLALNKVYKINHSDSLSQKIEVFYRFKPNKKYLPFQQFNAWIMPQSNVIHKIGGEVFLYDDIQCIDVFKKQQQFYQMKYALTFVGIIKNNDIHVVATKNSWSLNIKCQQNKLILWIDDSQYKNIRQPLPKKVVKKVVKKTKKLPVHQKQKELSLSLKKIPTEKKKQKLMPKVKEKLSFKKKIEPIEKKSSVSAVQEKLTPKIEQKISHKEQKIIIPQAKKIPIEKVQKKLNVEVKRQSVQKKQEIPKDVINKVPVIKKPKKPKKLKQRVESKKVPSIKIQKKAVPILIAPPVHKEQKSKLNKKRVFQEQKKQPLKVKEKPVPKIQKKLKPEVKKILPRVRQKRLKSEIKEIPLQKVPETLSPMAKKIPFHRFQQKIKKNNDLDYKEKLMLKKLQPKICISPKMQRNQLKPVNELSKKQKKKFLKWVKNEFAKYWRMPASVPRGTRCQTLIKQRSDGCILDIQFQKCHQDRLLRRTIENAIMKASPIKKVQFGKVYLSEFVLDFVVR